MSPSPSGHIILWIMIFFFCTDITVALQSLYGQTHGHIFIISIRRCLFLGVLLSNAAESESVFLGSLQAEQPFGTKLCALLLCSPIS
jgi:hypothetical protein